MTPQIHPLDLLKTQNLVDSRPNIKFIASGSAAAALRLKSRESGAGRFTDFMLPPLTFYEFLRFVDESDGLVEEGKEDEWYTTKDINRLNQRFVDYLNYGGYPEAVLNRQIRDNAEQFIRNDIIDKILLKDLPSLYGIREIQELNKLFSFLAYNTGEEASLENISQGSGITKPTIVRYIEYLESAFLIIKLPTIDENCRTLSRERNFKVYLNNPSMRAALFAPVTETDGDRIGHLAESAAFSQWQHAPWSSHLRYARWRASRGRGAGEVDIVLLGGPRQEPQWACEIKWSDRVAKNPYAETASIQTLLRNHNSLQDVVFTTKTNASTISLEGRLIHLVPTSLYCYTIGRNITARLDRVFMRHFPPQPVEVIQTKPDVTIEPEPEAQNEDR